MIDMSLPTWLSGCNRCVFQQVARFLMPLQRLSEQNAGPFQSCRGVGGVLANQLLVNLRQCLGSLRHHILAMQCILQFLLGTSQQVSIQRNSSHGSGKDRLLLDPEQVAVD